MLTKRFFTLIAVSLFIMMSITVSAQEETILDHLTANEDLSTFVELLTIADLADALTIDESITLFAPTNDAFATLPEVVRTYIGTQPELLTRILTYHMIDGIIVYNDLFDTTVATIEGADVTIALDDMGANIDQAHITTADIEANNGMIHLIDSMLVPPIELPEIAPSTVSGNIVTAGSSTVAPVTIEIATAFGQNGYFDFIEIDVIGTGAGFERFCEEGSSDISNASRAIRQSEVEACNAIEREPLEFRVGTDAMAVVINPDNTALTNLSLEQLAVAFSTAELWSDIDSSLPDEPILRFAPGVDSGTFDYFVEIVFDDDTEPLLSASNTVLSEDDNYLLQGVADNEWAIGFFGYAYYQENSDILSILDINNVTPNLPNVDSAAYPLARPLFIYSDATIIAEKPQVGQFISFYLSNVNSIIEEVGYFPANPFEFNLSLLEILALTDTTDM